VKAPIKAEVKIYIYTHLIMQKKHRSCPWLLLITTPHVDVVELWVLSVHTYICMSD